MKKNIILTFLIAVAVNSCSVDYDFDIPKSNEPERIIVNGLLNPSEHIQIRLYRLQNEGCTGLKDARVILKEEEDVLYDGICYDSLFSMTYFPKANAAYAIEVSCDGLETVKAQTRVPAPIRCNVRFITFGESGGYFRYDSEDKVELNSFEIPPAGDVCLWITAYRVLRDNEEEQYNELYTKNALVDKANSVVGMGVRNEAVGSIYHNGFIRVKNKNLPFLDELVFTPAYAYVLDKMPLSSSPQTKIKIKLITASPEYDRFGKSLYEQKSMIVYDEDPSSVFFQPRTVYSNIENGTGIFAGINDADVLFDIPAGND